MPQVLHNFCAIYEVHNADNAMTFSLRISQGSVAAFSSESDSERI